MAVCGRWRGRVWAGVVVGGRWRGRVWGRGRGRVWARVAVWGLAWPCVGWRGRVWARVAVCGLARISQPPSAPRGWQADLERREKARRDALSQPASDDSRGKGGSQHTITEAERGGEQERIAAYEVRWDEMR